MGNKYYKKMIFIVIVLGMSTAFVWGNSNLKTKQVDPTVNFTYTPLTKEIKDKINGISYQEDSPVGMEDLYYVQVLYWGFDDKEHIGELIVHKEIAKEVTEIFEELYNVKFPIEKIKLIDEYNARDELSMKDNNTSAYCFRPITGQKEKFSKHSYGIAIDINPIQNPYIKKENILPEEGKKYTDRKNIQKGMIVKDNACYKAFKSRGWIWGGEWKSLKDYQHFEKNIKLK